MFFISYNTYIFKYTSLTKQKKDTESFDLIEEKKHLMFDLQIRLIRFSNSTQF